MESQYTPPPGAVLGYEKPPPAGPEHRLTHDGRFGELFVLFLINLLLTIVTAGIYRFWGKTRIRRYVWSHTALNGERLEYTGTGGELFLGFLFAFIVFGLPFGAIYAFFIVDPPRDLGTMLALLALLYLILFFGFFLYYVAIFATYRYRLSRTKWHGIRGGMEGSSWLYGLLGFGLGLLNGISLGWTKPWADSVVFKYRLSRTWFGSVKMQSDPECGRLYLPFTLAWLAGALGFVIAAVWVGILFSKIMRSGDPTAAQSVSFNVQVLLAYLIPILGWSIAQPWYKAALFRELARRSELGPVRFRCDVTGGALFGLMVPNFLLMLVTLGLAYPYVLLRSARFMARHVSLVGPIDLAGIQQSDERGPSYGEGLFEFFGIGML